MFIRHTILRSTLVGRRWSSHAEVTRKTLGDIRQLYSNKTPISMITAHDYITGKIAEAADVDVNLIGDSLAMTALGYEDTNEIDFDEFLYHVQAVARGNKKSFLVADVPFGTYEASPEQALSTAVSLVKYGRVQGIKIEGGVEMVPSILKIVSAGIPVMGHTGLTPQHHNAMGGFKLQGTSVESAVKIYQDCLALQKAGVFSIVLECIPNKLAEYITSKLSVPTIGIGAGAEVSGQVLVVADILGMNDGARKLPKFVKQYTNMYPQAVSALQQYREDVVAKKFPHPQKHGYKMKTEVLNQFKTVVEGL